MDTIDQMEDLFEVNPVISTVDNKSKGEPLDSTLNEMKEYTYEGIKLGARHYKVEPSYPDKIGWNFETIFTVPMITGYQIEEYDESGYINEIGYNPLLTVFGQKEKKKTGLHEGYHKVEPGKRILFGIYYDIKDRKIKYGKVEEKSKSKYPVGKMIIEGSVELGVEKEVKVETSYPVSYDFANKLNQYFNLIEIHKLAGTAEVKLEEKLKDPYFNPNELKFSEMPPELAKLLFLLNESPGVKQLAHNYAVNSKIDVPYIV